jgi:hypothetical protein
MLNNGIKRGMLKRSENPYRNSWFLAKKKDKISYRLINTIIKMNRVIIKDINMFPSANEFAKKFSRYTVISLVNFFSRYNQIELDPSSRDVTAFIIPLNLLKITTLLQKITNSVVQFIRIIIKILKNHYPYLY